MTGRNPYPAYPTERAARAAASCLDTPGIEHHPVNLRCSCELCDTGSWALVRRGKAKALHAARTEAYKAIGLRVAEALEGGRKVTLMDIAVSGVYPAMCLHAALLGIHAGINGGSVPGVEMDDLTCVGPMGDWRLRRSTSDSV